MITPLHNAVAGPAARRANAAAFTARSHAGRAGVTAAGQGVVVSGGRSTLPLTGDTAMQTPVFTHLARILVAPLLALTLALTPALPAQAVTQDEVNATLGTDAQLWSGLFALAVADQIREKCGTIEARTLRATAFVYELYSQARDHGFSRREIRAFQTAETTEARMRAEVAAYFAQHGVRAGDSETYCALGLAEIAAGSQAGELLRAR